VQHAKEPFSPVAGPYGHPFHPLLVTLPIGTWIASLIFDIATQASNDGSHALTDASYWLILIGIIGAAVAALFGLMDLIRIPRRTRAFGAALTHMALNTVVLAMFVINFIWRHNSYSDQLRVSGGQLALSAVAIGILAASGWIGGMLSYRYGVRVAAERDQATGYNS
jgi:uncharacterized membrane protein